MRGLSLALLLLAQATPRPGAQAAPQPGAPPAASSTPASAPQAPPAAAVRHIAITARRFEFDPATLELEPGVPVILELRALDRVHGFSLPDLGIEARLEPGAVVEVPLTPTRPGRFAFHCHIFCGSGHEEMTGVLVVREPKR